MSKFTRSAYWRLVRERAWTLSKEHFQLAYPFAVYVLVVGFAWWKWGKQRAIDDFLKPDSLGLIALAVIAVAMYVFNVFRAAADIHAEQLSAIGTLEQTHETEVAELRGRLAALNDVPDPLQITFEPGRRPFEETHTVEIGIPLGGLRTGVEFPIVQTSTTIRVRVENTSDSDIQNVAVRFSFEPERPGLSKLPLRLMNDRPEPGQDHKRTFTLPAYDHRFVDVIEYPTLHHDAAICHTMEGVQERLPHGMYDVIIAVHGSRVRQRQARFSVNVTAERLVFQNA